ncbi:MAG: hypothetical protein IJY53_03965 [Akkermansia sp.]|nr:hypothetical protein [Akkermansia sp.]
MSNNQQGKNGGGVQAKGVVRVSLPESYTPKNTTVPKPQPPKKEGPRR